MRRRPLDPRLPPVAKRVLLDALRPTRIVGSDGEQRKLPDGVPVEVGDALVVATSGTSGEPKGVVLTHDAVAASAAATTARLGIDPARHTWLACLPLAHIGGLSVITRSIVCGTPLVVLPGFEADEVEALGRSGRVTHVSLVSTALQRLDPSVFACVLLGGSKPPVDLPPNAVTTYGMTETGSGVVYDGVALEGVELALRSVDGSAAAGVPDAARARSLCAPRCCSAVTATAPPVGSKDPTEAHHGSPPATAERWLPTAGCPSRAAWRT